MIILVHKLTSKNNLCGSYGKILLCVLQSFPEKFWNDGHKKQDHELENDLTTLKCEESMYKRVLCLFCFYSSY
jgi:hypothetical protein